MSYPRSKNALPASDRARLHYQISSPPTNPQSAGSVSEASLLKSLHELHRHEFELEAQNDKLQQANKEQLFRLNRALRLISSCNKLLVHACDEQTFLNDICHEIVKNGDYLLAWAGYAEQDKHKTIRPIAQAGHEDGYLDTVNVTWADTERGRGPMGTSIRTATTQVFQNWESNPLVAPWREQGLKRGYQSSIALPLMEDGKTFGSLGIYAKDPFSFNTEEVELLEELASNLAYGIVGLRARIARIEAEKSLHENRENYRLVLENAADSVLIANPEGRFIYVNQQAEKMLGYSAQELLTMSIADITPADEVENEMAMFEQLKVTGNLRKETHQICRDGSVLPVELNAVALPDGSFYGSCRDITERKRTEIQVAEFVKQQADHVRQLEEAMQGTLLAVSNMVEMRDPYTAGHEQRVGIIAADIAREMGWSEEQCEELKLLGLVHDIGKIGIPTEILTKPSRLTALEYEIVKSHAERSYEILKDVKFPRPIAEIIRQHHERIDGSGYPQGLSGEEILPEARILAVADVVESMASHRPYRPALGIEAALGEITSHRGTLYDDPVVDALLSLIDKGYQLPV